MVKTICDLTTIPASADILIGTKKYSTPDIISASVSRTRGQLVSSCSVSFHAKDSREINAGDVIIVKFFGESVFTGYIKRLNYGPSFRCDGEIILRIQAEDALFRIENRNFTRRQKLAGLGPIAFITSIYRRTYTGFDSPEQTHDVGATGSPVTYLTPTFNMREQFNLIGGAPTNVSGDNHPTTKLADRPGLGGASAGGGGGGFILHDHTTLDTSGPHAGGPAFSVFGVK